MITEFPSNLKKKIYDINQDSTSLKLFPEHSHTHLLNNSLIQAPSVRRFYTFNKWYNSQAKCFRPDHKLPEVGSSPEPVMRRLGFIIESDSMASGPQLRERNPFQRETGIAASLRKIFQVTWPAYQEPYLLLPIFLVTALSYHGIKNRVCFPFFLLEGTDVFDHEK